MAGTLRTAARELLGGRPTRRRLAARVRARALSRIPVEWFVPSPALVDPIVVHAEFPCPVPAPLAGGDYWLVHRIGDTTTEFAALDVHRRRPTRDWNVFDGRSAALATLLPVGDSSRAWDALVRGLRGASDVDCTGATVDAHRWARAVLELGAAGIPLSARELPAGVAALVGPSVAEALAANADGAPNPEIASVRTRRAVLRDHGPTGMRRRIAALGGVEYAPTVSVLLATMRPGLLDDALARIARQTWPETEVVVGCHGFAPREESRRLANGALVRFLAMDASHTLGEVLDVLVRTATGSILAKWDDDDLYDPCHLEDLVHGLESTRADVVGKASEFMWLEAADTTVRRHPRGSHTDSSFVAGAALAMTRRLVVDVLGGWPPVARGADTALRDAVLSRGGRLHRIHGLGFVAVRAKDADSHTWAIPDAEVLARASDSRPGLDTAFAGFEPPDDGD